jgi:hypothetical protein
LPTYRYYYPDYYFIKDPITGFDISKDFLPAYHKIYDGIAYKVWSNNIGCYDTPYEGEENSILLLGDSFTWGYAPFEHKWGSVLENEIEKRVLKCGVSGYGTKQEIFKLKKLFDAEGLRGKIDLIILGYLPSNDVLDDYLFPNSTVIDGLRIMKRDFDYLTGEVSVIADDYLELKIDMFRKSLFDKPVSREMIVAKLSEHSIIYNLIIRTFAYKYLASKIGIKTPETLRRSDDFSAVYYSSKKFDMDWLTDAWKNHLKSLHEIKMIANKNGIKLLVVIIPDKINVYDFVKDNIVMGKEEYFDFKKPFEIVKTALEEYEIQYLDLTKDFREYGSADEIKSLDSKNGLYWKYDAHWNVKGNKLAALLIARHLIENGLVNVNNSQAKLFSINKSLENIMIYSQDGNKK